MASIRKRGNSWHVQVRRRGFPNLTNSLPSKAEALAWGRAHEHSIDSGDRQPTSRSDSIRLADLLKRYETEVSAQKRGADREAFKIRVLLRSPIATLRLSKVTSAMIAAYRDQRLQVVKAGTVRRELALLRHCFEIARREWGIPTGRNPFLDVKMPSVANSRDRRLEATDHKALQIALNRSTAWYLAPMIELAIETGMRRGELLALQWSHVAVKERIATLPMTKNGRSRRVPLTNRAASIISALPRKGQYLFPVKPGTFGEAWERLVKRASLDDLRFHDLRHEAISRFFELGLSVPEVALISGHRDYRMLLRYTHIRAEDVARKLL